MDPSSVGLVAHAATANATNNAYIAARDDLLNKLYPPLSGGFVARIAVFHALGGV